MDGWGGGLEVMGSRDGIMTTESPSAALGNLPHTRPQGPSTPRTNNAGKMQVQIQIQIQIQIHAPRGRQSRVPTVVPTIQERCKNKYKYKYSPQWKVNVYQANVMQMEMDVISMILLLAACLPSELTSAVWPNQTEEISLSTSAECMQR